MRHGSRLFFALALSITLSACASRGPSDQEKLEADAHAKISQSLFDDGHFPESLLKIDQAIEIDPKNPNYLMAKGLIFFRMDRLSDAEHWVRLACQERKEFPECWNNLSVVLAAGKKYKEAAQMADKALNVPTYTTPELAYRNKSVALLGMKKTFEAKAVLKKALSQWPKDCAIRIHLARAQSRDRAFEDAFELNSFTKKICTDTPLPLLWESYIFYKIGNLRKSRYSLEGVIRFFPKSSSEEWARSAMEKLEQRVPLTEPPVELNGKGV